MNSQCRLTDVVANILRGVAMRWISGELGLLRHTYLAEAGSHSHVELLEA